MITATIYSLNHQDIPFYIGKTINPLRTRLSTHLTEARSVLNCNSEKNKYIISCGYDVQIQEIEIVSGSDEQILTFEQYWQHQFYAWGFPITNPITYKTFSPTVKNVITNRKEIHLSKETIYKLGILAAKSNMSSKAYYEKVLREHAEAESAE